MISPEIQRIVLLVGLAITGYLMILAWNEDYLQSRPVPGRASAPELMEAPAEVAPAPQAGEASSDIPDASFIAAPEPGEAAAAHLEAAQSDGAEQRLVRVSTPSQEVWIDLRGGDIRRVQLPGYPVNLDHPDVPFELLNVGNGRLYMAQSGLIGPDGLDSGGTRPLYAVAQSRYRVDAGQTVEVRLQAERRDVKVEKVFTFRGDDYLIDLAYRIENAGTTPFRASMFGQIKRDAKEPAGEGSFSLGPQPYLGAALTTVESRYQKVTFDDLDEGDFRTSVDGGWIAFLQHYFLSAWVADKEEKNSYYGRKRADGTYIVGYTGPLRTVAPGRVGEWRAWFYAGPKDQKRLEQIAANLNLTVDYGFLWWLAVPLFWLLDWLHSLFLNWGMAIIMLTFLVKLVLYPLSSASYKSMANMRRVSPQMKRLQERYADDRQKLSQEMMALYKKEGVNPLGGCLPMLLPMPIFIALYWVLFESVELRHAPFMLWIDDLAAMDPYFVLPLLMGGTMYAQQLLTPAMGDPMQVRIMRLMPVMFTVLFLFFPAGLVLYWLVNSVLSIAQQWYVMKKADAAMAART